MANGLAFYNRDFLVLKKDKELISESITRILMTNPGERLGQPYFGVGLRVVLFDHLDDQTTNLLEEKIKDQCSLYEPRATIKTLSITTEDHTAKIVLSFYINSDPNQNDNILTYNFDLE